MRNPVLSFPIAEELLKRTMGRCPVCHSECPAEVWRVDERPSKVVLKRICPHHGLISNCIASDARFYWLSKGKPENAFACCPTEKSNANVPNAASVCCRSENVPPKGAAPFETLSTCLALIEIVRSCNLSCPTCYADSPLGAGLKVDAVPLVELKQRIEGVIQRKGPIEILQLSGGEPTLHPQFFELLEWVRDNPGIEYVLLNTNGVRFANEPEFAKGIRKIFARGGLQVYLQFDGLQSEGQRWLRGADLRLIRQSAIHQCGKVGLPITLAMTVTRSNLPFVWEAIEFGLEHEHIHGITFQPIFGSGRVPQVETRLNTADILLAAVEQSKGNLRFEDFTPLPCGDPNCATIGYLIRGPGRIYSISDFIDLSRLQGFLKNKLHYTMADLARCGCENEPLGELLKQMELKTSMAFRLMVKPFMDAWSWDQDRIDRCCTHVIRPDGKLDSFCRYYSGFSDTKAAP